MNTVRSRSARRPLLCAAARPAAHCLTLLALAALLLLPLPATAQQEAGQPEAPAYLNVTGMVPLPGDTFTGEVVFFFDQPLAKEHGTPKGSETLIDISPHLSGKYRTGENYVAFRAFALPKGQRTYKVGLAPFLRSEAGHPINPAHREHCISTFTFEPNRVWFIESLPTKALIGVLFPLPVNEADLVTHLRIMNGDGNPLPFRIERGETPNIHRLAILGTFDENARLQFLEGLPSADGTQRMQATATRSPLRPSPLEVKKVAWVHFYDYEQCIGLVFSSAVGHEDLQNKLTIEDLDTQQPVPFRIAGREGRTMNPRVFVHIKPPVRLALTFAPGLTGDGDRVLPEAVTKELGRKAPELQVRHHYLHQPYGGKGKGGLVLDVVLNRAVDAASLREHLTFEPVLDKMRIEPSDDNRFSVYGEWRSKQRYDMTLGSELLDARGTKIGKAATIPIKTDEVAGYVGFGLEGEYYFPKRSGLALPLETRNATDVRIALHRMFPSNLMVALNDMNKGDSGRPLPL